jgi:hypothetical protein
MDDHVEIPVYEDSWRLEVLVLLRGIFECVASAPWMQAVSGELPVQDESAAAFHEVPVKAELRVEATELPGDEEPLPTWILTDEAVSRVEEAIEQEQRVRGRAYGGR